MELLVNNINGDFTTNKELNIVEFEELLLTEINIENAIFTIDEDFQELDVYFDEETKEERTVYNYYFTSNIQEDKLFEVLSIIPYTLDWSIDE